MALSGNIRTNVGSHWRLSLEWTASQNISNNTSTVTARLYWESTTQYGSVYSSATKTCAIRTNGSWRTRSASNMARLSGSQKKQIQSESFTVNHNSDGTASFTLDGYFDAEVTLSGRHYGRINLSQRTFTLNTIPRKSTMSSSRNWTAGSNRTISISRASSAFHHQVYVDVRNSSGNWVNIKRVDFPKGTTSKSTSFSVAENKKIFECLNERGSTSVRMNLRTYNGSNYLGYNSYSGTVTAPSASTTTFGGNFYIGDTISGNINRNNSRFTHIIELKFGNDWYRMVDNISSTSWSYNTSLIASNLYNKMPTSNSLSGEIRIHTYYEGVKVRGYNSSNLSALIRTGSMDPTFSGNFSYLDTNNTTVSLTNDDQYIIQEKSTIRVTIPSTSRAVASDGTSIDYYDITINGTTERVSYTSNTINVDFGTTNASSNTSIFVKAVDRRGNHTTKNVPVWVIPYSSPRINLTAKRNNGFENTTQVRATGSVSALPVGGVNKNSIQSITYAYRETANSSWTSARNISFSGFPNFSTSTEEIDLDNQTTWTVRITVTDLLGSTESIKTVEVGRPIIAIDSERKSVGFGDFPRDENVIQVNKRIVFGGTFWSDTGEEGPADGAGYGAIELNNSDIIQANGIYFNDVSQVDNGEGLLFLKSGAPEGSTDRNDHDNFLVRNGYVYVNDNIIAHGQEEILWEGNVYLDDRADHRISPSKRISLCPNGWILIWSRHVPGEGSYNDNWHTTFISKQFQKYRSGGGGLQVPLGSVSTHFSKYVYTNGVDIWGHSRNSEPLYDTRALRFVFAW